MPKFITPGLTEQEMFPYKDADTECPDCRAVFLLEVGDGWWIAREEKNGQPQQVAATECPNPSCQQRRVVIWPKDNAVWAKPTLQFPPGSRARIDRSYAEAVAAPEVDDDEPFLPDTDLEVPFVGATLDADEPDEEMVERARQNAIAAQANKAEGRGLAIEGGFITYEEKLAHRQREADKARAKKGTQRRGAPPVSGKFGDERAFNGTEIGGVEERRQPGVGRPIREKR